MLDGCSKIWYEKVKIWKNSNAGKRTGGVNVPGNLASITQTVEGGEQLA